MRSSNISRVAAAHLEVGSSTTIVGAAKFQRRSSDRVPNRLHSFGTCGETK